MYIPLDVGVIVAWQAFGGMGIGSGIRICSCFFCVGWFVTCTGGRLGWNMGFRRVTILAPSGLASSAAKAAFLAFFLAFLDLPTGGGGSAIITGFGGSVNGKKYQIFFFDLKCQDARCICHVL